MPVGTSGQIVADANSIENFAGEVEQFKRALKEKTDSLWEDIVSMQTTGLWDDSMYTEFRQLSAQITHKVEGIEGSIIEQSMLPLLRRHIEIIRNAKIG